MIDGLPAEEVSIGDYVLAGGELPAFVLIEAVTRLLPGVIGSDESHARDSFSEPGMLDHPHYTRPQEFRGMRGPGRAHLGGSRRDRDVARRGGARQDPAQSPRSGLDPRCQRQGGNAGAQSPLVQSPTVAMNKTDLIEQPFLRTDLPEFRPGDTVKVHVRVVEGNRERVQVFQGVVIRRSGGGIRETFTVRKISFGVGVERTFPLHSPSIATLEFVQRGRVRRAKLYYLRDLRGKKARIKERRIDDAKLAAMEAAAAGQRAAEAAEAAEADAEAADALDTEPMETVEATRRWTSRRSSLRRRRVGGRARPMRRKSPQRADPWPIGPATTTTSQAEHPTEERPQRVWREIPILLIVALGDRDRR